jgi:hypothetical protein
MYKRRTTRVLALALALLCLGRAAVAGTSTGEVNNSELSRRCAEALAEFARSAGATPSLDGARLRIGKDEVRLSAQLEQAAQGLSGHVAGVLVGVSINGAVQPTLTAGVVGTGPSSEEAAAAASTAWARLVGVALLDALGVKSQDKPAFSAGRFSVHAGAASLAAMPGAEDVAWADQSRRELLDKLAPVIRGLESSPSKFHLISVMVMVKPSGEMDGECRVDGIVSAEALKAARSFRWPKAANEYMLKQYYVLRRRPQAAGTKR